MTGGGEVAADLVGDAGVNDDIEEGEFLAGLEGGPGGGGGEAVACGYFVGIADEGHFAGGARLVGEGGIEPAGSVHDAVDEGGVVFLDGQVAELGTEGGVGRGGLGGENEAGGLRVEAMQQGREEAVVADIGQGGVAGDEGVGEGIGFGGSEGWVGMPAGLSSARREESS